jgi:hypothetical protein
MPQSYESVHLQQGQSPHERRMTRAQRSQFHFQGREELLLQNLSESTEDMCKLFMGAAVTNSFLCRQQIFIASQHPIKHFSVVLFYFPANFASASIISWLQPAFRPVPAG